MDTPLPALRVLLIEDNPGDARLVQAALAEQAPGEFTVVIAERLADALARIQSERFDAVLCDLGLPDSTGLGTAQAIAAQAPALPLVVLTGSNDVELGRAAIKLGAQDYLVKGDLKPPLLSRTLRYAIERTRLAHELREANATLEQRVAERTAELEAAGRSLRQKNAELERFNKMTVGRELVLIDLKRQVNALARELGRAEPFNLAFAEAMPAPPVPTSEANDSSPPAAGAHR